jgi:hypothetical protein
LSHKEGDLGTNYYSVKRGVDYEADSHWDLRGTEEFIHIGKSSLGWCFSLHVVPEFRINTYEDWVRMFIDPDRIIISEYNEVIPYTKMISIITARARPDPCTWDAEKLERNYAELGPGNLVRHRIDPENGCVGHGEGSYDYITGEFS